MKTLKIIIFISGIFLFSSCKNDILKNNKIENDSSDYFIARISEIDNLDCHLSEIVFEGDTTGISTILDDTTFTYNKTSFEQNPYNYNFLALNLNDSLKIKNLPIKIKFRVPLISEYRICSNLGPAYPMITILSASKLE